jgi:5,6,7,8-tetrahydromethanopterin hydro-lyase
VASGVLDAVADGAVAANDVDRLALIAAVWVDPAARDEQKVFANNRAATRSALENGRRRRPLLADALAARSNPWNPFFRP